MGLVITSVYTHSTSYFSIATLHLVITPQFALLPVQMPRMVLLVGHVRGQVGGKQESQT
jgi:hypothetical protein